MPKLKHVGKYNKRLHNGARYTERRHTESLSTQVRPSKEGWNVPAK